MFQRHGWSVEALVGSQDTADRLGDRPFPVLACDITSRASLESLAVAPSPDVLIHCASSRGGGESAYAALYRDGLANLIAALNPTKPIFTSSTSVYGQVDGSWVDEGSPAEPDRTTSRVLREAEALCLDNNGTVLRLAGIYGPGRAVLVRKLRAGEAVLEEGGGRWVNQIHRDDAASALFHAANGFVPSGIFNVADDEPASQRDIYVWLSERTGLPMPPDGPRNANRKRGNTDKRVSNQKLHATGWIPAFPSFREGYATVLTADSA